MAQLGSRSASSLISKPERESQLRATPSPPKAKDVETAAVVIGRHVEVVKAATAREIETAFARMVQNRLEALVIGADPLFFDRLVLIASLAARHALPAITGQREFVDVGGLMSYGASTLERYRHVGIYTGRILKGEKPADLPVAQPTKLALTINLKTAGTLGLDVPPALLATADEVIE